MTIIYIAGPVHADLPADGGGCSRTGDATRVGAVEGGLYRVPAGQEVR